MSRRNEMMEHFLRVACLLVALGCAEVTWAQEAVVKGFVTDEETGQALVGANVLLRQDGQLVEGSATDAEGAYLIPGLEAGTYELRVSYIGYQPFSDTLRLEAEEVRTVGVELAPQAGQLEEVQVESRAPGAADVEAGHQQVRPRDLERLPTPDVSGDLASYLTAQPGVVSTGDRGGQLFIRGGEPSQNRIFLDGMPVYKPFHVVGLYSAFPQSVLSQADIYAGGYPTRYNGGLSAVIDVSSRSGNKKSYGGGLSVSPFTGSLRLEGPLLSEDVSVLLYGRRSLVKEVAASYVPQPLPFAFWDAFAKVHADLGESRRLSLTHLQTSDRGRLGAAVPGGAQERVRWTNRATGLQYVILPDWLPVRARLSLSRTAHHMQQGPPDQPLRRSQIETTHMGVDAYFPGSTLAVNAGLTGDFVGLESRLGGHFQNVHVGNPPFLNQIALYVTPEIRWGSFLIQPGLRGQFYRVRFEPYLEPRLRLSWEWGIHRVSGAVGYYQQELVGLADRRDVANIFTAWANIPRRIEDEEQDVRAGRIGRALHTILGYRLRMASGLSATVEGYYKHLSNLFVAEWTAFPRFTTRLQPAGGRSLGGEVRVEWHREPLYGYLSYGYSNTRYEARQSQIELWYGTETLDFRPPHDRRHQVNALVSAQFWGVEGSLRWAFGSGRPFSKVVGFDGFALIDDLEKASEIDGDRRVIYERPFTGLLPAYHRLDVSLSRTFRAGPADVTVQASVINAYDRSNIFYLDTFTLRRQDQLPLVPSLGLKVELN